MNLKFYCYCAPATMREMVTFLNDKLNLTIVTHSDKFDSQYVRFLDHSLVAEGIPKNEPKNKEFDRYHFRSDRKILLYKLKKHYGNELKIDDNLSIALDKKQVQLLNEAYGYYEDKNDSYKSALIKETLRAKCYPYSLTSELNEISKEYKENRDTGNYSTYEKVVKELNENINDVLGEPKTFLKDDWKEHYYPHSYSKEYQLSYDPAIGDDASVTTTFNSKVDSKKVWVDTHAEFDEDVMSRAREQAEEDNKRWLDKMVDAVSSNWFK